MKIVGGWKILFFLLITLFLFPMICMADNRFEFTPRISVSQVCDDNIYLDNTNEKSDYLTTVSPGINMMISSINRSLSLDYSPTWVYYDEYDENDTVRHAGTLTFGQNIAEYLRFNLTDTYLKSEEPIEETEDVEGVRSTRNTYERNTGSANFAYQFGPEDSVTFGYTHSLLENEDVALEDGKTQNLFASMIYWFNKKNGLEPNYEFTDAEFSRDDGSIADDDYTGHAAGIRYIHRFSQTTTTSIGYNITTRDFDGPSEDYDIHEGSIGFEHAVSSDISLALGGGYFIQKNERSDDETGYSYNASLAKRFQRGSLSIGAQCGWDEAYLEAERRGFTRYWSADSRFEYTFMQDLNGYAGGSYRRDEDSADREWETWRANCGVRLIFMRWFSLSLSYLYAQRDDDIDVEDYTDNRVMLTLSASKLYRW
ncbi:MAG: outer membrane beta-barrel protein [Deltaproteobacteria bacterium]|nr:outer membrane beta-barrel protein [Deltaproteobacteria bacterium]